MTSDLRIDGFTRANCRWLLLTAAVVFFTHLPFALFSNEFQDGWIHALLFEQKAYGEIFKRLMDNGRPVAGWINLHAMTVTGFAHGAIWLSVIAAVVAGAAWYAAFLRTGHIAPRLAFVMAVVAAVTPANQIILSTPTVIFVSAHAFFAVGIWLFLEAHLRARTVAGIVAYVGACVCGTAAALLGEATAPMLVLYPMVTLLVDGTFAQGSAFNWQRALWSLCKRSAPVVLGCGAFAAMFILFPPVGAEMVSERRISFQPVQLLLSLGTFVATVLAAYVSMWLVIVWMLFAGTKKANSAYKDIDNRRRFFLLLAVSTAVFTLSPYIAALRLASPAGWGLRYLYYFGSALAWLLAFLAPLPAGRERLSIDGKVVAWLTAAVVAGLLLRWPLFAVRTVHEAMVVQAVSDSPLARQTKVFVMDDQTDVMAAPLRDVEWSGILQRALRAPGAIAAIASPQEPETTWTRWRFQLRQRMGWAPAVQPVLTPGYLREHVRGLQGHALVGQMDNPCVLTEVRVADPSSNWFGQAFVWYFRSTWQPDGYRAWLRTEAAQRISISKMPFVLDPCR
ncbi:MAG: hypothetical protein V4625_08470 [Pseudomonadota bacterium]